MVLKDWKKTINEKYMIKFGKRNASNAVTIEIYPICENKILKYHVRVGSVFSVHLESKSFELKSKALSYAKQYMRTH